MAYGKLRRRQSKRRAAQNTRLINELASLSYDIHAALPSVWIKMEALQRENMNLKASLQGKSADGRAVKNDAKKVEPPLAGERETQVEGLSVSITEVRKEEVTAHNKEVPGKDSGSTPAIDGFSKDNDDKAAIVAAPAV